MLVCYTNASLFFVTPYKIVSSIMCYKNLLGTISQNVIMQAPHTSSYSLLIAGIILIAIGVILEYAAGANKWFKALIYVGIAVIVIWVILLLIYNLPPL